jgi:PhnB protein
MSEPVHVKPEGGHTLTPHVVVHDAVAAIEYYRKVFGAIENNRMAGPRGAVMHAELQIGNSILMLADEVPEMGSSSPRTIGDSPVSLMLYVDDVDAVFERAVAAGAEAEMPPADMFWGDRFARIKDPFGHKWSLVTHLEDVDAEEVDRRAKAFVAEMAGG